MKVKCPKTGKEIEAKFTRLAVDHCIYRYEDGAITAEGQMNRFLGISNTCDLLRWRLDSLRSPQKR